MPFFPRSLAVVVLAAVWTVPLKAQAPDFIKLGEIVERCRQETGATNEDIQNIFLRKVPDTRSGQCMLACAGQGLGLMHDGNLDAEGTLAVAGRFLQGRDQKIQEAVRNAILTCAQYSDTRRDEEQPVVKHSSLRSKQNGLEEGYFEPPPSHTQKYLHSKTSSNYQPNHRVRRQSGQNSVQPQGVTPVQTQGTNPQTLPAQTPGTNQYPINQLSPNQQPYPLQTNPNNPVDQSLQGISLLGRVLNPNPYNTYPTPYNTYPNGPYIQPVVVASPYTVPVVPFRGKRSPQEVVLTSTEIALPPEVAAQISERLRELLLALISVQDGLASNSTENSERDAEVIESATRAPRKRREEPTQTNQESPLEQAFGKLRNQVSNGPLHHVAQGFRGLMSNATNGMGPMMSNDAKGMSTMMSSDMNTMSQGAGQAVSPPTSSPPAKAR